MFSLHRTLVLGRLRSAPALHRSGSSIRSLKLAKVYPARLMNERRSGSELCSVSELLLVAEAAAIAGTRQVDSGSLDLICKCEPLLSAGRL